MTNSITIVCEHHGSPGRRPTNLTIMCFGAFAQNGRFCSLNDGANGKSWKLECAWCRWHLRIVADKVQPVCDFIAEHPELLNDGKLSATALRYIVTKLRLDQPQAARG